MPIVLDTSKIQRAVQTGIPLSITTYTLPREMELYMAEVLSAFLKELDYASITEYLSYCLSELATNAKKANTKRVYFEEKKLDITKPEDYEEGMRAFKSETLQNIDYWLQQQKKAGYYIKLMFQTRNNKMRIEVRNNTPITFFEYKRIHDKIIRAQQFDSIEEAFSQVLDDSEGAGLGLVIMILMLQKIGLSDDNFQVLCENGETIMRILIPLDAKRQEDISQLSQEIVKMIDSLPQFPENIVHINNLLNDPNSKLSDIAQQISNDITLTADLLKLVNSAAFALMSPCRNISDAVKLIGMRGIKNLLYSISTIKTLGSSSKEQKELWTHSYQIAFYTYNLSRKFGAINRSIVEDAYVCGLLHDIGKVIFETVHPQLIEKFKLLCQAKVLPAQMIEKLSSGSNHAEIGALLAEKWNFPDTITQVIKFHHAPEAAPDEVKILVSLVYLANMISHYQDKTVEYYQFDPDVLNLFNITSEAQLAQMSEKLKLAFEATKN